MPLPLTDMYDKQSEDGFRKTPPGMAHWSGTGPEATRCWQCFYFRTYGYYSQRGKMGGKLKPGNCRKFADLMRGQVTKFDGDVLSCRHYEPNADPAPLFAKVRK